MQWTCVPLGKAPSGNASPSFALTGILGMNFDVFSTSPGFMLIVARMYFISSPDATSATWAVLLPSLKICITFSYLYSFSPDGPSRIHLIQWNLCFTPPPIPTWTKNQIIFLLWLEISTWKLQLTSPSCLWISSSQMRRVQRLHRVFAIFRIVNLSPELSCTWKFSQQLCYGIEKTEKFIFHPHLALVYAQTWSGAQTARWLRIVSQQHAIAIRWISIILKSLRSNSF